jgi:hypothetical protein
MACHQLVQRVENPRGASGSKQSPKRACQPDLDEEGHAAATVARNRRSVSTDEPPALVARRPGHRREQASGLLGVDWEQGKLLAAVERGDDTRRPTAEPSAPGIEQNRARKASGVRHLWLQALRHSEEPMRASLLGDAVCCVCLVLCAAARERGHEAAFAW